MSRAPFRWDLVIKIGGSLGRGRPPRRLMAIVAAAARRLRTLVVPGGGRFADLVRGEMERLSLPEAAAHRMALRAMDQYGLLLAAICPDARPVTGLGAARRVALAGRLPVLLASAIVDREPGLERTFCLTSDAIAAHLAARLGAARLVILKSVPGLDRTVPDRRAARMLARRGIVDPLFPVHAPFGSGILLLDGRRPERLESALREPGSRSGNRAGPRPERRGARPHSPRNGLSAPRRPAAPRAAR